MANDTKDGNKRWTCNKTGCSASVTTNKDDKIIKLNNMPVDSIICLNK